MNLPESVKIAKESLLLQDTHTGVRMPIAPGPNEVALLLAYKLDVVAEPTAVNETALVYLFRKSDNLPATDVRVLNSPDAITYDRYYFYQFTAVGYNQMHNSRYIILPFPVVLIRPPQLAGRCINAGRVTAYMQCYYSIQRASKEDISKLMVKDHA
jgi:hypothetical protein